MPSRREKIKFIILRTIGNFLVLLALWGTVMTFGPAIYLDILYRVNRARNIKYEVTPSVTFKDLGELVPTEAPSLTKKIERTFFGQITGGDRIEFLSPESAQYGIIIPKFGANAPIFPNVDAGQEEVYLPVLQKGVAHAAGTVFPGVTGNIFLFAHSTDNFWNVGRYNAIFYLLKELEKGDEVDLFYKGIRHVYRVTDKIIVDPWQVNYLTDSTPYEQLTLQTCWPPGTTWKRLIILARPERDLLN